jgi:hypothetical protein
LERAIAVVEALSAFWAPAAIVVIVLLLLPQIKELSKSASEISIAGVRFKRIEEFVETGRQNLIDTSTLQIIMAESRISELETVAVSMAPQHADAYRSQADALRTEVEKIRENIDKIRAQSEK